MTEPPIDSPEERADAWARALHWGTPEQLRARGIEPPSDSSDKDPANMLRDFAKMLRNRDLTIDRDSLAGWLDAIAQVIARG